MKETQVNLERFPIVLIKGIATTISEHHYYPLGKQLLTSGALG
jgi:hypothetical protein